MKEKFSSSTTNFKQYLLYNAAIKKEPSPAKSSGPSQLLLPTVQIHLTTKDQPQYDIHSILLHCKLVFLLQLL